MTDCVEKITEIQEKIIIKIIEEKPFLIKSPAAQGPAAARRTG